MRYYFILSAILYSVITYSKSNNIETIYLFPGQGSDSNIFNNLNLNKEVKIVNIHYPIPAKDISLKDYSKLFLSVIDTDKTFVLIGVSFGGMICTELADLLKPEKVIIIGSAKCRSELPFRYRFQKQIPINKIVPKTFIKIGAKILQPIVEPDRNKHKEVFKGMLKRKDKTFMKRSVNMIVNWDRKTYSKNIIHIHGTNDKTLPIRNIKTDYIVDKGSHMIMLTRGEELSKIINSIIFN